MFGGGLGLSFSWIPPHLGGFNPAHGESWKAPQSAMSAPSGALGQTAQDVAPCQPACPAINSSCRRLLTLRAASACTLPEGADDLMCSRRPRTRPRPEHLVADEFPGIESPSLIWLCCPDSARGEHDAVRRERPAGDILAPLTSWVK